MDDNSPLPEILRPQKLEDIIGQDHLVGSDGVLVKLLRRNFVPSMILWGPPGSGKTTLAYAIARQSGMVVEFHSAVTAKLAEIRDAVDKARSRLDDNGQKTILFIDEIHRFNKAQQDALLPHVEKGTVIFIGATTENPSFEVIAPLLSRCRVLVLKSLGTDSMQRIVDRGESYLKIRLSPEAREFLIETANGDARRLLSVLEMVKQLAPKKGEIGTNVVEDAAQKKMLRYDTAGDEHYNTISAFIKSMRASQVDAALYYLARMVASGEDPLFIARRMVIFAAEDIGLSQPTALVVANSVFDACHKVGYPEAQIILGYGVAYLSQAKKDRSSYDAYFAALSDVEKLGNLPIPLKILNAPTKLMKGLGYGQGYEKYASDSLLPEKLKNRKYYIPASNKTEKGT